MDQQSFSALNERDGVNKPNHISTQASNQIKKMRRKIITAEDLVAGILNQDKVALSRAITLVESTNNNHTEKANQVIQACMPYANQSIRIGITGVPGVGKSTFIEAFGSYLTTLGKKVAVLAIDPSSSISGGSILGDKTRMEELVKNPNAYIRPSASGESLGGVARKTRESIILCEACGFDVIIIETVGVGQSETAVHSMVDFFLLLNLAGAGDELQGIKRGIMEMADAIVINKADGDNVKRARIAKLDIQRALHLFPEKKSGWAPTASLCSALEQKGMKELWQMITEFETLTKQNGYFEQHRKQQTTHWMLETINEQLKNNFYDNPTIQAELEKQKNSVNNNEISPFKAAQNLLDLYFKA
ncbi:methylmalonyl Co-A mutase-associated GTPase MeaB [Flavobacterium agricola]|uniref:Methylmalonyl Co-A mutase-associated GTPase MeaB n=1 Tax=Flavobacterium agricola TaxID=2870839 RepID=A0ABY6LY89_9FLAO|nr:methylmalonyl Co-A mutase-associated GTPase MeaB [Flavobacterium agricola]UYW00354.1 methylmalonyl Co-A mutase-associated GTPase MeaB [Flavobacterium agricola]